MDQRTLLFLGGGLLVAGAAGVLIVLKRPSEAEMPICKTSPPSRQPPIPPGWSMYSGAVSGTAGARARAALSLPMGSTDTFVDDDGSVLGIVLMWHCHDPSEGVTPVGWHKGATLFRIG